ncbi:FGGY-family carbohydrate kinase [Alloscardovia venturai]|uniref:FGGY-family carbohydrate kinase n=1 Tax=Alloscardovia venturai TaxID=1769421 RepID=A0ABW2Y2Z6_9BIFI
MNSPTAASTPLFIVLDNGGTNTKALVFDVQGHQRAVSSFPTLWEQSGDGKREINLEGLVAALFSAIKDVLASPDIDARDIAAITCVGHGKGLYMLDGDGKIFRNAILSTDNRATALATQFAQREEEIYALSAQHVMPSQAPLLLRWLKDNEPEDYAHIGAILSAKDFVRYALTGNIRQEIGDASSNNLVNLHTRQWDSKLLDFFGIFEMRDALPALIEAYDASSVVSVKTAEKTGLIAGTPVVAGLFDIDAGAIGSGTVDGKSLSVIAGTWNINTYVADAPVDRSRGIMNSLFLNGKTLVEASSPTSAGNVDKMLRIIMPEELENDAPEVYRTLENYMASTNADTTRVIYTPFLYGSNADPYARGAFVGLTESTSRLEMMRAVYEGIAFAHKQHINDLLEALRNVQGVQDAAPQTLRICGGASHSPAWMQMFADITGMRVEILESEEISGLGGAILAAYATGFYDSLDAAIAAMTQVGAVYEPREEQQAVYERKYGAYQAFLSAMDGAWERLQ